MPSRKSREKICDAASRAPNETGCSPSMTRSDMSAPHKSKSMPLRGARVQQSWQNLCEMVCGTLINAAAVEGLRKGAAILGGSKSYREASNRVDRSHSVSTEWTCNEWSETP